MAIIKIVEKSKTKRKPGWQQQQAEYDAWLSKVNSMSTNFSRSKELPKKPLAKDTTPATTVSTFLPKSFDAFKGGGTLKVHRPELEYADHPEMLERELRARERKFNVAPAYNKGPTIYVSEDEITNQLVGGRRR